MYRAAQGIPFIYQVILNRISLSRLCLKASGLPCCCLDRKRKYVCESERYSGIVLPANQI